MCQKSNVLFVCQNARDGVPDDTVQCACALASFVSFYFLHILSTSLLLPSDPSNLDFLTIKSCLFKPAASASSAVKVRMSMGT